METDYSPQTNTDRRMIAKDGLITTMLRSAFEQPQETLRLLAQPAESHDVRDHLLGAAKAIASRVPYQR